MTLNYFDFHCHLDDGTFDESRSEIIGDMQSRGVGCTTIGVDLESSRRAVALAHTNHNIWASVGQHPLDNKEEQFRVGEYQRLIDGHRQEIVSVGECGLDYFWPTKNLQDGTLTEAEYTAEKARQKLLFLKNIMLAIANDLPLMLHVRSSEGTQDAHRDTLSLLTEYPEVRAVFHFYTEDARLAQEIVDAGYFISFPGVITFADLDEVVRAVPLERMFAETDSPYAAPKPYRGKTNCPLYVEEVYKKIAEVQQVSEEDVQKQILHNVENFLRITL